MQVHGQGAGCSSVIVGFDWLQRARAAGVSSGGRVTQHLVAVFRQLKGATRVRVRAMADGARTLLVFEIACASGVVKTRRLACEVVLCRWRPRARAHTRDAV